MSQLQRLTWRATGIANWLNKNNYNSSPSFVAKLTAAFLKSKSLPYKTWNNNYKGLYTADIWNAELVSNNFDEFIKFVKENYKCIE